jgi:hypothetical protein
MSFLGFFFFFWGKIKSVYVAYCLCYSVVMATDFNSAVLTKSA